jgi:hypothetical protein
MAAAQVLNATHTVDDTGRVRGVADIALSVDNRVAGVNERVVGVDDRVARIGDQVQGVDDKVTVVMDGAQYIFYLLSCTSLTHNVPRWKRGHGSHPTSSWRC